MPNPRTLYRKSDYELFTVNPDGTYSNQKMKVQFPGSLIMSWTYDDLKATGEFCDGYPPCDDGDHDPSRR
jgi:hypothetical protein